MASAKDIFQSIQDLPGKINSALSGGPLAFAISSIASLGNRLSAYTPTPGHTHAGGTKQAGFGPDAARNIFSNVDAVYGTNLKGMGDQLSRLLGGFGLNKGNILGGSTNTLEALLGQLLNKGMKGDLGIVSDMMKSLLGGFGLSSPLPGQPGGIGHRLKQGAGWLGKGVDAFHAWAAPRSDAPDSIRNIGDMAYSLGNAVNSRGLRGVGRILGGVGGVVSGMKNQSELGGVGDALGGMGRIAGMVPVIGKPIEALFKLGEVAFKAVDGLENWMRGLHKANMEFAQYSSAMTQVQVDQEIRDIQLSKERGDRRAGQAGRTAEAMSRLGEQTAPIKDAFAVLTGKVAEGFADLTSNALEWSGIPEKLKEWLKIEDKTGEGLGRQFAEASAQEWSKRFGEDFQRYRGF